MGDFPPNHVWLEGNTPCHHHIRIIFQINVLYIPFKPIKWYECMKFTIVPKYLTILSHSIVSHDTFNIIDISITSWALESLDMSIILAHCVSQVMSSHAKLGDLEGTEAWFLGGCSWGSRYVEMWFKIKSWGLVMAYSGEIYGWSWLMVKNS